MSKQIFFYLKKEEIRLILIEVHSKYKFKIYNSGLLDEEPVELSILETDSFLNVEYGDWNLNKKYLMIPVEDELKIRQVQQKNGMIKYAIDQLMNPNSVVLFSGGEHDSQAIIASKIGYIDKGVFQDKLMKLLVIEIKKISKKIGGWYVSQYIKKGNRLTTCLESTEDYDLKIT